MEGTQALGYVYVAEGAKADLAVQAAAIRRCCHARKLQLEAVVHDVAHPESGHHRPALIRALEQVAGGQVDTLVVARMSDLAFRAADVAPLLRWFDQEQRSLIALDTVAGTPPLDQHIARMRNGGMTLQAIADALNAEGVPTPRGGATWRPSSVQRATGYRRPKSRTHGIELPHPRRSRP